MLDHCLPDLSSLSPRDLSSLLPNSIAQIVHSIGLAKTIALVDKLGGTTFPVSRHQGARGDVRYFVLVDVVGVDAANVLTDVYGGESLYIPRCNGLLIALRNHAICAEFEQLTAQQASPAVVSTLARKHRLSDRWIWRILSLPSTINININLDLKAAHQSSLFC